MEKEEKNKSKQSDKIQVDEFIFMTFVYSRSTNPILKEMSGTREPKMKNTEYMLKVVNEKKPLFIENGSVFTLPQKHFPIQNCLLVPV
jgi:hypothetical protein